MDYNYCNQYYYCPSDHHNYPVDLPPDFHPSYYRGDLPPDFHPSYYPVDLPPDFHPSYYPPYYSFPSYDHYPPQFSSSYYASGFGDCSESFLVDPAADSTRFVISYSISPEFNEPEFKEYDPTPYAGGYDPSATYGVPLAPSDEICYPRSTKGGTIPVLQVPLREADKIPKDVQGGQEATSVRDKEEEPAPVIIQAPPLGNTNKITDGDPKERESAGGTEESGFGSTRDDSPYEESPEHIPYQPSPVVPGGGLDAVDICDGVFGYYWPCWDREVNRRLNGEMGNHHHHHHHEGGYWAGGKSSQDWQTRTADYLFGSSNPYDDDDDHTKYGGPASSQNQVRVNASVYSGNWL